MKLKFGRNKFDKQVEGNLQNRALFRKSHMTKLMKSLTNFFFMEYLQLKFRLHIMSKTF